MKVCVIQTNCGADRDRNFDQIETIVGNAMSGGRPDLVALPETFAVIGGDQNFRRQHAEPLPEIASDEPATGGPTYEFLKNLATANNVFIHGGSFVEIAASEDGDKYYNTSIAFDRQGVELARYRKIHRFDATAPDGIEYRESDLFAAGEQIVTYQADGMTIGCTICYDLRFAELYLALSKLSADLIMVPSAFTLQTGKDHWEVLLRARAIETQTFIAAPAQTGSYLEQNKPRQNWGHSMIVDPWGLVLAQATDGPGYAIAAIDRRHLKQVRQRLPVADHRVL